MRLEANSAAMSSDLTFITNKPAKSLRDGFGVLLGPVGPDTQCKHGCHPRSTLAVSTSAFDGNTS
jgi:hypothetical protein